MIHSIVQVLAACVDAFKRDVPNYHLNQLNTLDDIIRYFEATPHVRPRDLPLFASLDLKSLPPNLKISF